MFFYNVRGLLFLVLGFGIACLGSARSWWSNPTNISFHLAAGLSIAVIDIVYRTTVVRSELASRTEPLPQLTSPWRHRGDENSWLTSSLGGSLSLYSAWIFGILYAVGASVFIKLVG